MSATENNSVENNPQYIAAIKSLKEKDLQIEELRKENTRLQLLVKSALFGSKSERSRPVDDGRQGHLFESVELPAAQPQPVEQEIEVPAHKRKARKRYTDDKGNPSHFPEHLERRDTVLAPEGSLNCEHCGTEKEQIRTVVSEKLQVVPAQYYVERITKSVRVCKCCKKGAPVKAASPEAV